MSLNTYREARSRQATHIPQRNEIRATASAIVALLASTNAVQAQRAAENVVRSADDAFGATVGDEEIGLYSSGNVRGFSPFSAGNVRVEGLTIDQQAGFTDRLVSGSTIRAGLAAQGYLLPAPTGIVDFSLRRVAETPIQSAIAEYGPYGSYGFAVDLQARALDGLVETTVGAGYDYGVSGNGSRDIRWNLGGTVRLLPSDRLDVTVFGDFGRDVSDQRWVQYFTADGDLPPEIDNRRDNVGQPWVELSGNNYNIGLIASYSPPIADFELGVFRSVVDNNRQIGQFFTDVTPDKTGDLFIFVGPPAEFASTSLEARVARTFKEHNRAHTVTFNLRARQRDQRFGGATDLNLGRVDIEDPIFFAEPNLAVSEPTEEDVEQITYGLGYQMRWNSVGELNLGVQKTDYTRLIETPGEAPLEASDNPILFNAMASVEITDRLVAYGGVVRGFEEGPVAPSIALNRNEAPPAIETRQTDAGLRWFVGNLTAVAGVFQIKKPFFSLGADRVFSRTGEITNRGVEMSLAGPITKEIQMIAGAAIFDPTLSGDLVDAGLLSEDPIDYRNRRVTLDLDYRPAWAPGWSADVSVNHRGRQNADNFGLVTIDPLTILDVGMRKQMEIAGATVVVRAQVNNVFNSFNWYASESGAYTFEFPRGFSISLRSDF